MIKAPHKYTYKSNIFKNWLQNVEPVNLNRNVKKLQIIMPPAARVGDMTSHGTPLSPGPGAPTVLIGGKPAWRIADFHTCPLSNGPVPHVGGVLMPGSGCVTVLIGGQPAAKLGDSILEPTGGPNAIVTGEFTVMICG